MLLNVEDEDYEGEVAAVRRVVRVNKRMGKGGKVEGKDLAKCLWEIKCQK